MGSALRQDVKRTLSYVKAGWNYLPFEAIGSSTQNRLPFPGSDSTPTCPFMRCTPLLTMARPMPVPEASSA
ncbi:MAG: hypothetical protein JWR26_2999, partial [Pedosphaera sp.]|nr:hypothetical protein [Pedosphaera sp.]